MKIKHIICLLTTLLVIGIYWNIEAEHYNKVEDKSIKVGFIYVGDAGNAYTYNFILAEEEIREQFAGRVECIDKYNISEGQEEEALDALINEGCSLIFATSYGFENNVKLYAERYPEVEFCMATGDNADDNLKNYHTFMGEIYQGRYISGVVAGLKLKELIDKGTITSDEALIGYIGAFPFAEVISGYTAFALGVRSVVPEAKMEVKYSNSWNDYFMEKKIATELIEDGCVIISQHSDTTGAAVACESHTGGKPVFHVSYNQSMRDVAPTTSLIGCKINWDKYMIAATEAVLKEQSIESVMDAKVKGHDSYAGFDKGWVQMLEPNSIILPEGVNKKIESLIDDFKHNKISVFKGNYIGVNPYDENDTYDLNKEFIENKNSSAPAFNYIIKDFITIKE